jgi:hypothetical protein
MREVAQSGSKRDDNEDDGKSTHDGIADHESKDAGERATKRNSMGLIDSPTLATKVEMR